MSPFWWRFVLFGILGIFGEVVFTALLDLVKKRSVRLHGFSFIWMFPIYGLLAILFPTVAGWVSPFSWFARGFIYMTGIYLVELITGSVLTALTGSHIWQYTDRFNYRGQISLLYAPIWFGVGLLVERYYPWIKEVSNVLAGI